MSAMSLASGNDQVSFRPGHNNTWSNQWCYSTVMHHLMTGIRSEKCAVGRFRHRANVIECTYTNLDSIAYYTPRLYGIAYWS